MTEAPACRTCAFALTNGANLECREGPPTGHPMLAPDGKGGIEIKGVLSVFPIVQPGLWCGRWRAKAACDTLPVGPEAIDAAAARRPVA